MRKLKILAATAFAVFAISAVAAASAFAEYHIESPSGGTITGTQQTMNEYFTDVGTQKCTTATFSGSEATETASTLTVHPEYSGCKLGGQAIKFITTGCNYEFQKPVTGSQVTANVGIVCSGTNVITIKDTAGLGCEVKIGPQGPLSQVAFINETGGKVLMTLEITGISYSWTAGCPNAGGKAGSNTNGKFFGTVLFTGSSAISVT